MLVATIRQSSVCPPAASFAGFALQIRTAVSLPFGTVALSTSCHTRHYLILNSFYTTS